MPTDPETGERLPYPGEEEAKPKKKAEEEEEGPQLEEVMGKLDDMVPPGTEEEVEEEVEEGAEEAVAEEGEEVAEEAVDLSPLMDTLGATEERAQMLYDAAQQMGKTEGMTPQELADMIADDFDVLMQLEMIAARGEGGAMGGPAPEPVPGEAPVGEEMMPPEGM